MRIGILQSGHLPEAMQAVMGDYSELYQALLADQGLTFKTYDVVDMEFPESAQAEDGWLISGSRHGAYDDLPFIRPLENLIRQSYAAKVPMVGICFGHQIIAQALGGRVEKFDDGWAVGPKAYDFAGDTLTLNAWHQDQVVERPEMAKLIATHSFCENAGLFYDDSILTMQAHPEFEDTAMAALIDTRGPGVVPDDLLKAARAQLGRPNNNSDIADRIGAFFREAQHG